MGEAAGDRIFISGVSQNSGIYFLDNLSKDRGAALFRYWLERTKLEGAGPMRADASQH
jgi:hypothetical protein